MSTMTSNKPYFIRALYDWIVDNDLTPHILVDAAHPDVEVPQDFVNGGRIVLNIAPKACRGLHLDNDKISPRFFYHLQQYWLFMLKKMAAGWNLRLSMMCCPRKRRQLRKPNRM